MARAVADIEKDIRPLTADEKLELLRSLLRELDGPADANVEKAAFALGGMSYEFHPEAELGPAGNQFLRRHDEQAEFALEPGRNEGN